MSPGANVRASRRRFLSDKRSVGGDWPCLRPRKCRPSWRSALSSQATFDRRDEQLSLVRGLRLPPRLMFHHRVDDGEELAHHRDEGHLCWLASDPETSIEVA